MTVSLDCWKHLDETTDLDFKRNISLLVEGGPFTLDIMYQHRHAFLTRN